MNIHALAAEIASRVPEMARDSRQNNEVVITELIRAEQKRVPPVVLVVDDARTNLVNDLLDRELRERGLILEHRHQRLTAEDAMKFPNGRF